MYVDHQSLARDYFAAEKCKHLHGGRNMCMVELRESLRSGHITPDQFRINKLFEYWVPDGAELLKTFDPKWDGMSTGDTFLEADGAVMSGHFANITGQIMYTTVLEKYSDPNFLWSSLFRTQQTQFDGEKIPGIGRIGDEMEIIGEGVPYPTAGVGEEWIETPLTIKRGIIVPVTKEAIFFDRTGQVLDRAGEVAHFMGVNKEKRCLDVALGVIDVYNRNGAGATATYANTGQFVNLKAANPLVDWTSLEQAELLFDKMSDPNTGEPISIMPDTIVCATELKHTANRLARATQVRHGTTAVGASAGDLTTLSAQPTGNQYSVLTNQYVHARLAASAGEATTWFIGQPNRAFRYMENWGPQVDTQRTQSDAAFERDIVARYKISERGAAAVFDPRYMVKCTAT